MGRGLCRARAFISEAGLVALKAGYVGKATSQMKEYCVVKKAKRQRRQYTKADEKELRAHSKAKTPVEKISKLVRRTTGALRGE
jgi:hypothetical protein